MRNVFRSLSRWFVSGTEDFFTASLALFLERNEDFREEFLDWLAPRVKDDLHRRHWTINAQVQRPSCKGTAILDMVFSSPDLELWFEHKIGAAIGKYGNMDQIEKYLDAANRVMLGVEDGKTEIEWPGKGPEKGYPRVVLFYVARSPKAVDSQQYQGRVYQPQTPYGVVLPPFSWRRFWPRARNSLDGALRGEWGEFEKTLALQFLGYWRSIPGMWKAIPSGADWSNLLPDPSELQEGQPCPFGELWDDLLTMAARDLHCRKSGGWLGYEHSFDVPEESAADIDHI